MNEEIFASGKLFELVHVTQDDGRVFELARRAPGVRVILADLEAQELLLTKEFRRELNEWDFRLPGGKVFDSLKEYDTFRKSGADIVEAAAKKAKAESAEEAGVEVDEVNLLQRSTLGATVEWDLFVFVATKWRVRAEGQALEAGERVEAPQRYSFSEVEQMILDGRMQEERIALVLLRWLKQQTK